MTERERERERGRERERERKRERERERGGEIISERGKRNSGMDKMKTFKIYEWMN